MYQRPVMCKISVPGVIFIHEPPATLSVYETLTWLYKPISIHQISPPSSHCIALIGQLVPFIFIDKISVSKVLNKLSLYHHRQQLYFSLSMTIQEVIWCLNVWLIFPGYYPQKISDRVETVVTSGAVHHHIEAYQAVTGSANVN